MSETLTTTETADNTASRINRKLKVSARAITKAFELDNGMPVQVSAATEDDGSDEVNGFWDHLTHEYELDSIAAKGTAAEYSKEFWALRGIDFDVYDGDIVGVVGTNGSGKSTLLNIISGVIPQTSGELTINGDVSVVAINNGLNNQLTGRENIRLKQLMMGKSNSQIDKVMPKIIEFSELGEFIDQPVKTYSSGMKSKLGFAIAVEDNPDIMIIDEALSVGDSTFSKKALGRIEQFMKEGKTIFFVSHSLGQVRQFTNKVMWIQYGELKAFGDTKTVADQYEQFTKDFDAMSGEEKSKFREDNRLAQRLFTLDNYRRELVNNGDSGDAADKLVKRRSFRGLNPGFFYPSVAILSLLMLIVGFQVFSKG